MNRGDTLYSDTDQIPVVVYVPLFKGTQERRNL